MAYIGLSPVVGEFRKLDDISSQFNDSNTTFNLTVAGDAITIGSAQNLIISVDGVIQEPQTSYTTGVSSISFTEAPNTASSFFGILLGSVGQVGVPSDGTITEAKIAAAAVTETKIAANAVTTAKIADGAITADKIADGTIIDADVAANAITEAKIASNAVESRQIATGAVTTDKIADAAVTSPKLAVLSNVTITGGNIHNVGLKVENVISTSNVVTLNYANATVFTCTATEATTITPSNFPASGVALLKLRNGGNVTISYAANAQFADGLAPSLTAGGLDHLFLEGNTTVYTVTSILNIQED